MMARIIKLAIIYTFLIFFSACTLVKCVQSAHSLESTSPPIPDPSSPSPSDKEIITKTKIHGYEKYQKQFLRDAKARLDKQLDSRIETDKNGFMNMEFEVFLVDDLKMICRQVPGDGNCLFHALNVGLSLIEDGVHPKSDRHSLWTKSTWLRKAAVEYLQEDLDREIYLEGDESWNASVLLHIAAYQYDTTIETYCENMRTPSTWGGGEEKWGGGPEIVAICNLLERPIHVYELMCKGNRFCFHRIAQFGSPFFDHQKALHILSADSRFPDIEPGRQCARGNHFLALIPLEAYKAGLENEEKRKAQGNHAFWDSVHQGSSKFLAVCGGFVRSLLFNSDQPSRPQMTGPGKRLPKLSFYDVL
mmetsp:Transcript_15393/g.20323  ORF Transcript_15393/g.20323 Transcript_15393/m.20323 type:complete len:361 (-) Transcript_15393:145-1227(-)